MLSLDIALWNSPQGGLLPSVKEAPFCVCLLAFRNSLAATVRPLLLHLCLLGLVCLVLLLFSSSVREMEPHLEHFLSKWLYA